MRIILPLVTASLAQVSEEVGHHIIEDEVYLADETINRYGQDIKEQISEKTFPSTLQYLTNTYDSLDFSKVANFKESSFGARNSLSGSLQTKAAQFYFHGPWDLETATLERTTTSGRCDPIWSINDFPRTYRFLPIYGIGLFQLIMRLDRESGLRVHPEERFINSCEAGSDREICKLSCPKTANNPEGKLFGQLDNFDKYNGMFECFCSKDLENPARKLCFWVPVAKAWVNSFSCDPSSVNTKKIERLRKYTTMQWKTSKGTLNKIPSMRWNNIASGLYSGTYVDSDLKVSIAMELKRANTDPNNFKHPIFDEHEVFKFRWHKQTEAVHQALAQDSLYQALELKIESYQGWQNETTMTDTAYWRLAKFYKLKHLMQGMMFFVNDYSMTFEKFFNYGCSCFKNLDLSDRDIYNLKIESGLPVDNIDASCNRANRCRSCSFKDFNNECHAYRNYLYTTSYENNVPGMRCLDDPTNGPVSQCRRAQCECDLEFFKNIAAFYNEYNLSNSPVYGNFDSYQCQSSCKDSTDGCISADRCCGKYPERDPYHSDGNKQCCKFTPFFKDTHKCCGENVVLGSQQC